jgi:hypothetical protein
MVSKLPGNGRHKFASTAGVSASPGEEEACAQPLFIVVLPGDRASNC